MRLCNDTITVFTASVDETTKTTVYAPTVLTGCSWYATNADTVDPKGGLVAARKVIVRIPAEVMPAGLEIRAGDIVVRESLSGSGWTPAFIRRCHGDKMITVLAVTENRRAPNAPHLKVVGS